MNESRFLEILQHMMACAPEWFWAHPELDALSTAIVDAHVELLSSADDRWEVAYAINRCATGGDEPGRVEPCEEL